MSKKRNPHPDHYKHDGQGPAQGQFAEQQKQKVTQTKRHIRTDELEARINRHEERKGRVEVGEEPQRSQEKQKREHPTAGVPGEGDGDGDEGGGEPSGR